MAEKNKVFTKDEVLRTVAPKKSIKCKDCVHRLKPVEIKGKSYERFTYGACDVFERKPPDVLWEGADCERYKREN